MKGYKRRTTGGEIKIILEDEGPWEREGDLTEHEAAGWPRA